MKKLFGILLIVTFSHCQAQLAPVQNKIEVTAKAEDSQAVVQFTLKNIGNYPITVLDVQAACSCSSPALEKHLYQPGETGTLKIIFNVGWRQGDQRGQVTLSTDDKSDAKIVLDFVVHLPHFFKITVVQPLSWLVGEPGESKSISLTILPDIPMHLLKTQSSNLDYGVSLKKVGPKSYTLQVNPPTTATPSRAIITISSDYPTSNPKTLRFDAAVLTEPPAKKSP